MNRLDPDWAAGLVELAKNVGPHLTVIDTVARSMQGGDENASRDMGALICAADALRFATGTTALLVQHTPRNADNLRGHSSLEGAVDTAIEVRANDGAFALRCAKQKDAAEFEDIRLAAPPSWRFVRNRSAIRNCQQSATHRHGPADARSPPRR